MIRGREVVSMFAPFASHCVFGSLFAQVERFVDPLKQSKWADAAATTGSC